MRRRNPLGIIITGYGGFGGRPVHRRVARRGVGLGSGPYFYGLGQERYTEEDRLKEMQLLEREVEEASRPPDELVAANNLRALDAQIARERAAQATVNERGEPLYLSDPGRTAPTPASELTTAAKVEAEVYAEALQRAAATGELKPPMTDDPKEWMVYEQALSRQAGNVPASAVVTPELPPTRTVASTAVLAPPTSNDPQAWMAWEAAMARAAGVVPPGASVAAPAIRDPMLTPDPAAALMVRETSRDEPVAEPGPMPSTAPGSARTPAGTSTQTPAGTTQYPSEPLYVAPPTNFAPPAPVDSGGCSLMLLGGAALALFLLMR